MIMNKFDFSKVSIHGVIQFAIKKSSYGNVLTLCTMTQSLVDSIQRDIRRGNMDYYKYANGIAGIYRTRNTIDHEVFIVWDEDFNLVQFIHDIGKYPIENVNHMDMVEFSKTYLNGNEICVRKVFIAHPMNGIPDDIVEEIREKTFNKLKEIYPNENFELIDQFHIPEDELPKEDSKNPRIHILGRSIQKLSEADLVVFTGDFTKAKGCCIELEICQRYSIPYIQI